jgi:hypothetical protein
MDQVMPAPAPVQKSEARDDAAGPQFTRRTTTPKGVAKAGAHFQRKPKTGKTAEKSTNTNFPKTTQRTRRP